MSISTKRLVVQMSLDEHRAFKLEAYEAGVTMSELARERLLGDGPVRPSAVEAPPVEASATAVCEHARAKVLKSSGGLKKCPDCGAVRRSDGSWSNPEGS